MNIKKVTEIVTLPDGSQIESWTVYETNEYDLFNFTEFNRKDADRRSVNVLRCMAEREIDGQPKWIGGSFVLCNENLDIIDGQSRFTAAKDSQSPFPYMVVPGLTNRDIIDLNSHGEKWKTKDYLFNYQGMGVGDYPILWQKWSPYRSTLSAEFVAGLLMNSWGISKAALSTMIRKKQFERSDKLTERQVNYILKETSDIYWIFRKSGMKVNKRKDVFLTIIEFMVLLSMNKLISLPRFKKAIPRCSSKIAEAASVIYSVYGFIDLVEAIYNMNCKTQYQVDIRRLFMLDFEGSGCRIDLARFLKKAKQQEENNN